MILRTVASCYSVQVKNIQGILYDWFIWAY